MNRSLFLPLCCLLLAGCNHGAASDDATAESQVAVTTTKPVQQTFHDTVEAWGSAAGDPQRVRVISLAHGGQVVAIDVAAGQCVKRGQPLFAIAPDPATRSAYQQAQHALSEASGELARTQKLVGLKLATQSQLASARKAQADARAALDAQRAIGGDAPRETVNAPADGVVMASNVGLGERFAANAPLLNFNPAQTLVARLGVQPQDGAKLRTGMPVQLRSVYDDRASIAGRLRRVGHVIDPQTHLLDAQVDLPATASMPVGTTLDAQIRIADFTAWAVPRAAVLHDERGDYLFQLVRDQARRVDVHVRSPDGDTVGVQGPLDAQVKVIVLGAYELADGDAVRESTR